MQDDTTVDAHYGRSGLLGEIVLGLERLGKAPTSVTVDDLAPVDEFHVGGRVATEALLDQLAITAGDTVLDVGCGIGGASRFAAATRGCRVTGVDLTAEYVAVGNVLSRWVGLDELVRLVHGDITSTDTNLGLHERAIMLHVGMNIADKAGLAEAVYRLLRPGGVFGIYDLMRVGAADVTFPVPWATRSDHSALASPAEYRDALERAGFEVSAERNRRDFALEFIARLQSSLGDPGGPPPLGLHLLMGAAATEKYRNMVAAIQANVIAPVEMVARKPG